MAYNILVIDDSKTVRTMILKTIDIAGIPYNKIHQACNGREGLEILKKEWIDLVLTDINMPEMNGLEMIAEMVADNLLQTVPVVVISTEGSETRIAELKKQGIVGYIRKPFTPEAIKTVIEDVLGGCDAK